MNWRVVPIVAAALCTAFVTARAQAPAASIAGRVADLAGTPLPGADVQVISRDRAHVEWSGTTGDAGDFTAPGLPAGTYDVSAEIGGFARVVTEGLTLRLDQRLRVDIELPVGAMHSTITVDGRAAGALQTSTPELGLIIDAELLRSAPLPGRAVVNLLGLAGGVSAGGPATALNPAQISINGGRTLNFEITVEGLSLLSGSTGVPTRLPSAEALGEIGVRTALAPAEFGRTSGSVVNLAVKAGTKSYHGGAYSYIRHEALNANDYFRVLRGEGKPRDRSNLWGGTLGGPVRIPGLYDGRARTFFFAHYETVQRRQPSTQTSTIPDLAFRRGDFSASAIPVIDPLTRQAFPGNRIPEARIDPAAAKILALLPAPNAPGTSDDANGRRVSNYVHAERLVPTSHEETTRLDHELGANDRMFGHLTVHRNRTPASVAIPGPLDPALGDSVTAGHQLTLGWTHRRRATLLEVHGGWMRDDPRVDPLSLGLDVESVYGIARAAASASPRFNISGYGGFGMHENTYRRQTTDVMQASAAVTRAAGSHSLRAGAQFRINRFDVFNPGASFAGIYNFNGEVTSATSSAGNPVNSLADFLLGAVQTAQYEVPQRAAARRNVNVAAYAQDDWRLSPALTLNAGLRYDYESPVVVEGDIYSRVDPATGRLLVAGRNASRALNLRTERINLGPRVGLAYAIGDRTVVRGGAGLYFGQVFSNLGGVVLFPGFTVREVFADPGAGVAQPFRLGDGHPLNAARLDDPFAAERAATPQNPLTAGASFGSVSPLPSTWQWSASVQREVGAGIVLDAAYVGTRGQHLPLVQSVNQVRYSRGTEIAEAGTALAAQLARPFPAVAGFTVFSNDGHSSYHALQTGVRKRSGGRLEFLATWTWSRATDDGSGLFGFSQPYGLDTGQFTAQFPGLNRAPSAFDRPHVLVAAASLDLGRPKVSALRWLRGTRLAAMFTARSGLPDTITQTSLHPAAGQQRPDLIAGADGSGRVSSRTTEGAGIRYLLAPSDPAFPFRPVGPLFAGSGASRALVLPFDDPGTLGRNTIREPAEVNLDVALSRRLALGGPAGLTLRIDAFNVLNRLNLNGPDTALNVVVDPDTRRAAFDAPRFGLITSAKPARSLQVVLRVDF